MIEVQDLTKDYGPLRAIDKLNFKVNKGEVVGFLGPNGAGKSTAMKIITGFMAPTSGSSKVGGDDVFVNPIAVKKRIGYLPETPPLYSDMYVRDYLGFVARLKGISGKQVPQMVNRAVEKCQLGEVEKRLIGNLSKGFRQRVGIAQAIVADPEVLILDEPTVGLDPKQVTEIRSLIRELKGQHTIILSTHILPEVQATCERIIIIHKGKIIVENSLAGLSQMMQGQRSIHLKVKRPSTSFVKSIEHMKGVHQVKEEGAGAYVVQAEMRDEVLESIATQAVKEDVGLLELQSEKMNLEEIFLKLTYGDSNQGVSV